MRSAADVVHAGDALRVGTTVDDRLGPRVEVLEELVDVVAEHVENRSFELIGADFDLFAERAAGVCDRSPFISPRRSSRSKPASMSARLATSRDGAYARGREPPPLLGQQQHLDRVGAADGPRDDVAVARCSRTQVRRRATSRPSACRGSRASASAAYTARPAHGAASAARRNRSVTRARPIGLVTQNPCAASRSRRCSRGFARIASRPEICHRRATERH